MPAHRIVSLLPSSTEIACALGLGPQLVGRSHECDHPEGLAPLPVCTRARLAPGSSRQIDDSVRDLVSRGLSVYEVDASLLRSLRPSIILTQDQCEVCAVSPRDLVGALADWIGEPPELVSLRPATLGDVWADIGRVARAAGVEERGTALARELADRVSAIGERTGGRAPRPSVACIEWLDPIMGAGHWMPELVSLAGGRPLFGDVGERSPTLDWAALRAADPDVIVIAPCGFDVARTRQELAAFTGLPGFDALRAVRAGRVAVADGNAYFNRPGPRLVESLEILAEILHPDSFAFGHEGSGWELLGTGGEGPPRS
jgi:iron complex transport system substrate-binding protein